LAGQVGIHFSHLSKIENGQDPIGRDSLIKIAEELGVDPDLMLGEAGHQAPFHFECWATSQPACQLKPSKMLKLSI
jgi:transcriptional regulator with XRE-family HTH domain